MKPSRLCLRSVDFRADSEASQEGDGHSLEGYAAVFDVPTEINSWEGFFTETVARGAFKKTLRERMPVLQFDHGHDARTGSVPIGAFTELKEDDQGLYVSARLFDNPVVEPIRQAIEGQAITGMSFRFEVTRDEWRDVNGKKVRDDELGDLLWMPGERGPLQRTIKEVKLFEAGPVVFPAYEATSVGVRSLADLTAEDRAAIVAEYARTAELQASDDAAPTGTSPEPEINPDDAAPEGTSDGHEERDAEPEPPAAPISRKLPEPRHESRKDSVPMRTIEEFRARLTEIRGRMAEIDAEAPNAVLTPERQTEWDALETEYKDAEASIERATARSERLRSFAVDTPAVVERGADQGRPQAPAVHKKQDDIYDLDELRKASFSGDDFVGRVRENALRAVERARFGGRNADEARSQVEYLLDTVDTESGDLAKRLLITGSPTYERAFGKTLKALSTAGLNPEEARSMVLGTDASGGFAVPFQLDPTVILTNNGAINPLRQMARIEQIVGKEWQGISSAGITVSRDAESAEVSDDSFTIAQPVIRPTRVAGFVPFSIEIDSDWGALRSEITRLLGDAREREEADSFVNGNGTPPNPSGVVATLSGNTVTAAGTAAFAAADVYKVEEALAPRWRGNAQWLGTKFVYNKVRQFDTAGGAQMWERIGAGQPSELLGYKANESSAMATALTTGQKILLFGDFSQFLIVDRVGMSIELIPHLLGSNRRPTGERGIYAIWRNSSKILVDAAFKLLVTG